MARRLPDEIYILAALVVMAVVLSLLSPAFLTPYNLLNILSSVSVNGIMACGMAFVIIAGGIDISVGSVFAVGGAVAASLLGSTYTSAPLAKLVALPVPLAILGGLIVCALLGFVNGIVVAKLRVPPFIATLGMMGTARGLTYLYTGGFPITFPTEVPSFRWIGSGFVGPIPSLSLIFLIIVLASWWLLRSTVYGRYIYAIGGNEEGARLSGIRISAVKVITYTLLGALSGLSGIILTARINAASPEAGLGYELDVITAVVIGGTLLSGGKGTILGTVVGIFIMAVLANGLNLLGVQTYYQYLAKGVVLILAVIFGSIIRQRAG
jgi:ribose/xylose/arabinose/galactoside ABC-type transport system permease subunit